MTGKRAAVAALVIAAGAPFGASAQLSTYAIQTMTGQRLVAPSGAMEVHVTRDEVAARTVIATHMHFWPRYVFVESGEVQVTVLDGGAMQTFTAGQTIVEPLEKWHSGLVTKKAVLIAIEQTPPGGCNTIHPPVKPDPSAKPPVTGGPMDACPHPSGMSGGSGAAGED